MSLDPKSTHYDAGGIEALDVIRAKLTPEQFEGYLLGNALKYLMRMNWKGAPERDAEKAAYYIRCLREALGEPLQPIDIHTQPYMVVKRKDS